MTGLGDSQPKQGGRISVVQQSRDAEGAVYELTLSSDAGQWKTEATLRLADRITVELSANQAPEWLQKLAIAILRTSCRERTPELWPRRLTRWRDEPRAR